MVWSLRFICSSDRLTLDTSNAGQPKGNAQTLDNYFLVATMIKDCGIFILRLAWLGWRMDSVAGTYKVASAQEHAVTISGAISGTA